jgi:hypothetical protein
MQSSFRPVALRLPLSDVAALAAATARLVTGRWRSERALGFAFRLRLRAVAVKAEMRWINASELLFTD